MGTGLSAERHHDKTGQKDTMIKQATPFQMFFPWIRIIDIMSHLAQPLEAFLPNADLLFPSNTPSLDSASFILDETP